MDLSGIPRLVLPHHFAHACCAYYLSTFKDAAVMVADGAGGPLHGLTEYCAGPEVKSLRQRETVIHNLLPTKSEDARESESFYHFEGAQCHCLRKVVGNWCGIGAQYGSASDWLFGDCLDAGKTMGLAAYGSALSGPLFLERIDTDTYHTFRPVQSPERDSLERAVRNWRTDVPLDFERSVAVDLAATIQAESEAALLTYARWLKEATGSANLCLGGGVALNSVANSRLAQYSGFDNVFVPSAPGDDGISVGCALYGSAINGGLGCNSSQVFLGKPYPKTHLEALPGITYVGEGAGVTEAVVDQLVEGAVVAWFQGGAELGPRALGHRSFLADPRNPDIRARMNGRVKNREAFRPFAPVVPEEFAPDFFETSFPSRFMSFVANIQPMKRSLLPGISHVDGTARYQTLRAADAPELSELIHAFARRTGIPILLNTSFNRAGEPLVETPLEAARCFLASSADLLVVDGGLYKPSDNCR